MKQFDRLNLYNYCISDTVRGRIILLLAGQTAAAITDGMLKTCETRVSSSQ